LKFWQVRKSTKKKIIQEIQVTASIADPKTEKREMEDLREVMERHNLKAGYKLQKIRKNNKSGIQDNIHKTDYNTASGMTSRCS